MFLLSHYDKIVSNTSDLTCGRSDFTDLVLNATSKNYNPNNNGNLMNKDIFLTFPKAAI